MNLNGRIALVVGAANAVGPQVVEALATAGAKVIVDSGSLERTVFVARNGSDWKEYFDRCESEVGVIDILVQSPKIVRSKSALELTQFEIARVIEDELLDPMYCIREAAGRMAARRKGRIITLVSMSGKTGVHKKAAAYAAAKGGVIAFSRSVAADLAPFGVTVNCIATALFEPQVEGVSAEHRAELLLGIPAGRFGRAIEAAHAVLYLAADEAGFVTGETLNISGGRFMD